jgi:hypothetical protein
MRLPSLLLRRELALFVQRPTALAPGPAGQIGFVLHNRLRGSQAGWPELALFWRGLSDVLFTITPFPPSLCPS